MAPARDHTRFDALRAALGDTSGTIRFARAPGRVNLIGDHTDYQDGYCLPIAIDRDVLVGFRARADERVHVTSLDLDARVELPATGEIDSWARAVASTFAVVSERIGRPVPGFDAAVTSTVPIGAGLSSSAAFDVALSIAATTLAGHDLEPTVLARVAQEIEQRASGVPCGLMDQLASIGGRRDHALLLDCRSFAITAVAIPAELGVLVVHSGVERALAGSAYAERRAACEAAAARLGIAALRDATIDQVADNPFARHVVSENARVLAFVDAVRANDAPAAGGLMLASHRSLRDDFAVSTPELDRLVDLSVGAGAFGARLTGAGFGGCIVALVPATELSRIAATVEQAYHAETGRAPAAFAVKAVDGAGLVAPS
jgi:galactokinase